MEPAKMKTAHSRKMARRMPSNFDFTGRGNIETHPGQEMQQRAGKRPKTEKRIIEGVYLDTIPAHDGPIRGHPAQLGET